METCNLNSAKVVQPREEIEGSRSSLTKMVHHDITRLQSSLGGKEEKEGCSPCSLPAYYSWLLEVSVGMWTWNALH